MGCDREIEEVIPSFVRAKELPQPFHCRVDDFWAGVDALLLQELPE